MATIFKTDGTTELVEPKNHRYFTLEELKQHIGGGLRP